MTAIERTAYPRFKRNLTAKDLAEVYTPTPGERFLAARSTKGSVAEVGFLVLLKTYQRLGRFILLSEVPVPILEHIAKLIDPHLDIADLDGYDSSGTRQRHIPLIRAAQQLKPYRGHHSIRGKTYAKEAKVQKRAAYRRSMSISPVTFPVAAVETA